MHISGCTRNKNFYNWGLVQERYGTCAMPFSFLVYLSGNSGDMPLSLIPFPQHFHPPFGVTESLPVCRNGVRSFPEGTLQSFDQPAFAEIIIRRYTNGATSRGICGLLPTAAFRDGRIKPHEETLLSRLERQEHLIREERGALGKPVLLTVASLKDWWDRQDKNYAPDGKDIEFAGEDNFYRLRTYLPKDKKQPAALSLDNLGTMVIADGHHRAETHARLMAAGADFCEYIPVCLIGADELHVGIFARLIHDQRSLEELLPALKQFFSVEAIEEPLAPEAPGIWLLVSGERCFHLRRKKDTATLHDADWLEHTVLPAVFDITDTRSDERIEFEAVTDIVDGKMPLFPRPDRLSLYGYPVTNDAFFAEVDAGRCFPPKSTRFEPRVPSGLVVWMPQGE
ncbi:Uncharacterized conserved protein, DUF1015 family [Neolewinella agarilytica]|uniref:Uncharacterized conserved protein, DUF1015 family n=2 Tax=Neolewinella agarilytica TaxID=478744 RepID=A0A1H9JR18_9BACT|nr:Uncharacterized conserved protein, DUF1015 family [Neolewinella agarilytica]